MKLWLCYDYKISLFMLRDFFTEEFTSEMI